MAASSLKCSVRVVRGGILSDPLPYALLFAQKTTAPSLATGTYVFLWNVVSGDSYDEKYTLKGTYACSIEKNGAVYAFTQHGGTLTP